MLRKKKLTFIIVIEGTEMIKSSCVIREGSRWVEYVAFLSMFWLCIEKEEKGGILRFSNGRQIPINTLE